VGVRHVARLLFGLLFALAVGVSAQSTEPASPDAVARDLQKKYDRVADFSADFVHSYRGGVLKQEATERGHLLVKKPGKMRWDYTSPEKKTFVSDGHKLYSYIPQDKQVIVATVPPDDHAPTPALFLTGKGNIARDFSARFDKIPEAPPATIALTLVPKKREPEFDWLTLVVQPDTLRLSMMITVDPQGGRSVFAFTNLKENTGLADNEFVFRMPRGVDVIDAGAK
jgi:outer membrane lipoprotein carrier protein